MTDDDWELLLGRIKDGLCTPFLGAGACVPALPLGADLSREWAAEFEYPMPDSYDLARVTQFMAVRRGDQMFPKERMRARLGQLPAPDFGCQDEPHAALAELPLPLYMTTNYDAFMVEALNARHRDAAQEICRWNSSPAVQRERGVLADRRFEPSATNPVVFHLHGRFGIPESMVLTENDYLDFLVAVSRRRNLLPHQIQRALSGTSLLFIGYKLADWSFRVLHRGLVTSAEQTLQRLSVTVQLRPAPKDPEDPRSHQAAAEARAYLERYFDALSVRVYWGDARAFALELRQRWAAYDRG